MAYGTGRHFNLTSVEIDLWCKIVNSISSDSGISKRSAYEVIFSSTFAFVMSVKFRPKSKLGVKLLPWLHKLTNV